MVKNRTDINPFNTTLDKLWCLGDSDGGGSLDKSEVFDSIVMKGMNFKMKEATQENYWQQADRKNAGELQREDFERLIWLVKSNHDVCKQLWRKYTHNEVTRMRPVQMGQFLRHEQEEGLAKTSSKDEMEKIFKDLTGSIGGMDEKQWNIYLTQSVLNDALRDESQETFQCMKRPWPDYYVKFAANIPKQTIEPDMAWDPENPEEVIPNLVSLNYRAFHMQVYGTKKGKEIEGCTGYIGDPKGRKEDFCQLETALEKFKSSAFQPGTSQWPIILLFEVMCKKESDQAEIIKCIQEEMGFRLKDSMAASIIKCPFKGKGAFMVGAYAGEGVTLIP
eukprot:gene36916-20698_t